MSWKKRKKKTIKKNEGAVCEDLCLPFPFFMSSWIIPCAFLVFLFLVSLLTPVCLLSGSAHNYLLLSSSSGVAHDTLWVFLDLASCPLNPVLSMCVRTSVWVCLQYFSVCFPVFLFIVLSCHISIFLCKLIVFVYLSFCSSPWVLHTKT